MSYPYNPAHPCGTCAECGEEMVHNIPRMGAAGGFVHKATGQFQCGPRVEPVVTSYCPSCEALRLDLAAKTRALEEICQRTFCDVAHKIASYALHPARASDEREGK